jgi:rubrerythrin
MGSVSDMAAEEAARAEAENPDAEEGEAQENEPVTDPGEGAAPGDDPEHGEQEATATPPEPSSEKTMEERSKLLAAAHKTFTTRISKVMEEDANNLEPCPLCWPMTQGYVWPGMPVEEERKQAVRIVMGEYGADQFEEDQARAQCPVCKGKGMLKTGSMVTGQDALNCRRCSGMGWIDKPGESGAPNGNATPVWTTAPPPVGAAPQPPPDQWGRPFGHPHFGQNPAMIGV